MMAPIRLLHLEDNRHDADLVRETLAADGVDATIVRVENREEFEAALATQAFDVILSDYNLPVFDGLSAQVLAAQRAPEIPFIFLSGSIGEEQAVERLKDGATDYVLKDRMARLPSAVRRALAEAAERAERHRAEDNVRRLNAELERRVIERTAELARANAALAANDRELRDAKSVLEDLIAASPSMIFRLDPVTLDIVYASPNVGWLLGYTTDEITQIHDFWVRHIHPDDRHRVVEEMQKGLADNSVQIEQEYRLSGKDDRYRWFFSLMRVEYDATMRPATILRYCLDIADRKAAEAAVHAAREEAERANHAKSDFLSRMSHDLRTPLNAILGFAQLLELEDLGVAHQESVRQILKGGQHLLSLINEVLDIARIEAGHLTLSVEPVSAPGLVAQVVELVTPLAAARGITLQVAPPAEDMIVLADKSRLNQVILNLLSNAVKYNRPHGQVTVGFERSDGGRARIAVADTGPGMPPEKLPLLFQPFERLGAEQTAVEGTGLGLALSRRLAEAMGGSLGVASAVGRGTTFWIDLPLTESAQAVEEPSPRPAADVATGRPDSAGLVLYIEDNGSNVRLMERVLQRRPGVRLRHAATGGEGLQIARMQRPDLILLDLHLPDMTGEEVLRRLREDFALGGIPVAVLSADATPDHIRRIEASGAVAYLTKPLEIRLLMQLLDEQLRVTPEQGPDVRT